MNRAARLLLIIGIVWTILVCGCGYLTLFSPGIATRWRQEPAPPVALTRLALGQAGEVVASASDGSTYEFKYGNYRSPSSWSKVDEPSGSPAIHAMTEITCSDFVTRYQSARNPVIVSSIRKSNPVVSFFL